MPGKEKIREEYGWVICIASALLLFCTGGLATTGFSTYQPYLISLRGFTNTQSSTLLMIRSLFSLIGMLLSSRLIGEFEIRRVVSVSMLVCAASFLLYGVTDSYTGNCVGAALAGISLGVGGMIPASILISRWFLTHRGLALGLCMSATGLSALVASPVITFLVNRYSLRFSLLVEAAFVLAAGFCIYLMIRSNPRCLHTQPIGAHSEGAGSDERGKVFAAHSTGHPLMYLMMIGIVIFGMAGNNLSTHISVLYSTAGMSSSAVAELISIMGVALAVGKCSFGLIADKIGTKDACWIFYALLVGGAFLCTLAGNGSFLVAMIATCLVSVGLAVVTVSISMYASRVATEKEYSGVVTKFQILSTLGTLLFGSVPGIIADHTGSYVPAFRIMCLLAAAGALILQYAYKKIRHEDHIYVRQHVNLGQLR